MLTGVGRFVICSLLFLVGCAPHAVETLRAATFPERVLPWPTRIAVGVRRIEDASMLCAQALSGEVRCWTSDVDAREPELSLTGLVQVFVARQEHRTIQGSTGLEPLSEALRWQAYPHFHVLHWPSETPSPFGAPSERSCHRVSENALECWPPLPFNGFCPRDTECAATETRSFPAPVRWGMVSHDRGVIWSHMGGYHVYPHACGLMEDRTVRCWGGNSVGQIGTVHRFPMWQATTEVVGVSDVQDLALGAEFSCALHTNGRVTCWGYDHDGQLGGGASNVVVPLQPVRLRDVEGATSIYAGNEHACAMGPTGVTCWGDDYARGIASEDRRPRRLDLPENRRIVSLVLGAKSTCALDERGDVWCGGSF